MSGENPNDPQNKTAATPPVGNNNPEGAQPSDKGPGGEPMIPKSRFDDALEKVRKDAEAQRKLDLAEFQRQHEERMTAAAAALQGRERANLMDPDVKNLQEKYGVNPDFTAELLSISERRATERFSKTMQPFVASSVEQAYQADFNRLVREYPNAANLSNEEMAQLRAMAFDKKYQNAPIEDVYKIFTYGRPTGKPGVEMGRGGSRQPQPQDEGMPDFSKMSPKEFEEFSNKLASEK